MDTWGDSENTILVDQIRDCKGLTFDRQEQDQILVEVESLLPGRERVQAKVDLLNKKSVPVSLKAWQYGGEWTRGKFTDNLRFAKKRLGIK